VVNRGVKGEGELVAGLHRDGVCPSTLGADIAPKIVGREIGNGTVIIGVLANTAGPMSI
jgi:hypothetical protein